MADNKYSVDDILKELNDTKRRVPATEPAPPPTPPREVRRPAPQQVSADDDDFWEMKKPASAPQPRRNAPQQREQARPVTEAPPRRPMRQPPAGVTESPRLGQNIPPPRNREEMGKLLNRFDDSGHNPLENLDFLEREPEQTYDDTPVKNFVPDWDKKTLQQGGRSAREAVRQQPANTERQQAGAPRQQQSAYSEPPLTRAPREAAPQQRDAYNGQPQGRNPRAAAPQPPRGYGDQPRVQQGARREIPGMYNRDDRKSMAGAARLITSGGFEDDDDNYGAPPPTRGQRPQAQQSTQPRQVRQPVQQSQPPYREAQGMAPPPSRGVSQATQQIPPIPRQGAQTTQQIPPIPRQGARPTQQIPSVPSRSAPSPRVPLPDEIDEPLRSDPRVDLRADAKEAKSEPRGAVQETEKKEPAKRETTQQIAAQLGKMKTGLLIRVVVNLLAMIGVVYLALAGEYDFPLPSFIAGEENIGAFLWTAVGMVITSALVSGNTIGGGILALFRMRPSNDSYSALAVFACLIQGSYMAMQPQLMAGYGDNLYLPMAALMLLFNTFGKLILLTRMGGSFRLTAGKGEKRVADIMDNREFARRISGDIVGDEPQIAYFTEAVTVDAFLDQAFSESKAEDISKIVAPLTALAALIMALVSYLFSRDIFIAACVYTAALCITAPLAGVIASNLPLSITNGKLARFGASLCGYDAVSRFAETNGVLLRCSQLFPKGSVSIQDIKVLDRRPIDQVIVDAASVLCACDSNLSGIFRDMVQDASMLHQPENLEYFDDMGLSAWVNGRRVLIGNRSLMMSYGVSIPGVEFERPYTIGNNEVMYLANSGEAAAMYVLSYKADKQMRRAMELLCDKDMAVCLYSTDPNLTAEKISNIYSFPKELLSIIPASMQSGTEKYLVPRGRVKASVVHNGTPASYLRTILAAQSCSKCITVETALILMSVVIGFAIVTFFAFTRQMESLTWITIAVYQFFWLLLELAIPLVKH